MRLGGRDLWNEPASGSWGIERRVRLGGSYVTRQVEKLQKRKINIRKTKTVKVNYALAAFRPPPVLRFPPRLVFALLRFVLQGSQYQVP
jgi:hypothetical protein